MSFGCNLYSFAKRQNSTARPTLDTTESEHFEIEIKEPFSIMNPQLVFEFESGYNPTMYNYAYIAQWERRYRITDWTNERGLWVASCDVDVLATWREAIGSTPLYVLRAQNAFNGEITDTYYPATTDDVLNTVVANDVFSDSVNDGTFIVGIVSEDVQGMGAVTYYAFGREQFAKSLSYLLKRMDWMNITSVEDNLVKAIFNPMQYIASCHWVPFRVTTGVSVNKISIGWWENCLQAMDSTNPPAPAPDIELAKRLDVTNPVQSFTSRFTLSHHPQLSRGTYLDFAPFCNMTLFYQPFGVIPLDVSQVRANGASTLFANIDCDLMSGVARLRLVSATGASVGLIDDVQAKVSFDVPLAQISTDMGAALGSAAGAVGTAIGGNWLGAGVGIASAIAQASIPKCGQIGSYSGALALYKGQPQLTTQYFLIADEDNSRNGRPLCEVRTPASLGGYMVVKNGDVSAPATGPELERIKGYLESGFYYE